MIILFISSLVVVVLACSAAMLFVYRSHSGAMTALRDDNKDVRDLLAADNKDLRDRMFQSKAMAPSGVDLTEVYEERKLKDRDHRDHSGKKVPPGPLERLVDKWKEKDLQAADQGLDLTESSRRAN